MKKRIIFPATNRVHEARQKLLIKELRKHFIVDIFTPKTPSKDLEAFSILAAAEFRNFLDKKKYDLALVRADRMELLLLTGILAYRGVKIIHVEGGNDSGARVIDTKVRDALTSLADVHLVTDEKSRRRVQSLGADSVHNVGSLDVSFAHQVSKKKRKPVIEGDYILFLHHGLLGEESKPLYDELKKIGLPIVGVKGNSDYASSLFAEEWSPEDFISVLDNAKVFVSNSSAACKESSTLGTPTVLVGSRQEGRLHGWNAVRVPHDPFEVKRAAEWQIAHGKFRPDPVYYRPDSEKEIVRILKKLL